LHIGHRHVKANSCQPLGEKKTPSQCHDVGNEVPWDKIAEKARDRCETWLTEKQPFSLVEPVS
jgi:hypothetical protein